MAKSSSLNFGGRASGPRSEMVSPSHWLQAAVIGRHQVAALVLRDRGQEPLPGVGKQHRGAVLVEPAQLALGQQEDAAQDQAVDAVGMGDGVGQGQGRAPRSAEHRPFLDAQMNAQALDVLDQAPGGVVVQAGVRARAAAAALVEQGHAPLGRVEEPPHGRVDRAARAAVQDHTGFAARVAAFLVIDLVRAAGGHPAEREGLDLAEQSTTAEGRHDGGGSVAIHVLI